MRVDAGARLVHFGRRGQGAILECALYVANSRHDWALRRGNPSLIIGWHSSSTHTLWRRNAAPEDCGRGLRKVAPYRSDIRAY